MRWPSLSRGKSLIILAACVGLAAGAAVRNLAYYPLRVTSSSMSPSIVAGDWVVISPQQAASETVVHRGDVVLFRFPFGSSGRAIKRVVAIAGHVTAGPDEVRVNGEAAVCGSLKQSLVPKNDGLNGETIRIPEGYLYILGDNIASSIDSRSLGPLPETEVMGKVSIVIKKPW